MKKIWFYAAAMAAMTACGEAAVEDVTPEVGGELVTITADAGGTRVAVDSDTWKATWEEDDAMAAINTTSGAAQKFTLSEGSGSASGTFTGTANDECYFVYPHSLAESRASETSFVIPMDLSSQQEGVTYNYMFATVGDHMAKINTSEGDLALSLRHVTSAFELNMTFPSDYEGYTIQSVVVSGLNGKFDCDVSDVTLADAPALAPITITDGVTTIASNMATVRFNAFSSQTKSVAATAYIKSGEGAIVVLSETLTSTTEVCFKSGLHHTLNCANMAAVDLWTDHASTEPFSEIGDGDHDPYKISTAAQLAKLANDVKHGNSYRNKFFKLTADIDLSGYEWESIGYKDDSKDYFFGGVFNGDGHKITGLYINQPERSNIGLFGQIDGGKIINLSVSGYVVGDGSVGGVVGYTKDGKDATDVFGAYVINCYSSCTVVGSRRVGGVVGDASSDPAIANCYNIGSVEGVDDVGGVVGYTSVTPITNCYNSGSVKGDDNVGGILGRVPNDSEFTINNCYNRGSVVGTSDVGSVVGLAGTDVTSENCYYLGGTGLNGVSNKTDGVSNSESKSAEEMQGSDFLDELNANAKKLNIIDDAACEWKAGADNYPTLNFGVYQKPIPDPSPAS